MKRSTTILASAALVAASLTVAPAAFADTPVTQTVTGGSRTASAAAVTLPGLATAHTQQLNTGSMTVTADDSTGTGAGWAVTEQVSALVYSGTAGGTDIPASNLAISGVSAVTATAGQTIDVAGTDVLPTGPQSANITSGVSGTLDAPVTVLVAGANFGQGTYTVPVNLSLTVPAESRVGTYTGTLTTTISAAP